jgi:hypothetical protein
VKPSRRNDRFCNGHTMRSCTVGHPGRSGRYNIPVYDRRRRPFISSAKVMDRDHIARFFAECSWQTKCQRRRPRKTRRHENHAKRQKRRESFRREFPSLIP